MRLHAAGLLALGALAASGCVAGSEARPTRAEAMRGPPADPGDPTASRMLDDIPGSRAYGTEPDAKRRPPKAGYVWVDGYWHWTGVRYAWVPGRWEATAPAYVRR